MPFFVKISLENSSGGALNGSQQRTTAQVTRVRHDHPMITK